MKNIMTEKNDNRVDSTPLSDFVRNASPEEKKRVYQQVMKAATESQNAIIQKAKEMEQN